MFILKGSEIAVKGIVDRKEEGYWVIEQQGKTQDVPVDLVESGVRPGDVVEWKNGQWVLNKAETDARTQQTKKLMKDVWED